MMIIRKIKRKLTRVKTIRNNGKLSKNIKFSACCCQLLTILWGLYFCVHLLIIM